MLTDEKREQLQLIQRCDPSFLLLSVKEHTNFDSALLEKVFELAKEQTRSLLAASAAPAKVDNWQQYAKEGETAQRCIERHRAEQDALLKLYGRAAPAEGRETADEKFNPYVEPEATTNQTLTEAIEWCIAHGNCGPRTRATLIAARSALATAPTMSEAARDVLWRHKKTGGVYSFVAESRMERDPKAVVVTYRNIKTGETWTRPYGEFHDGRFERIDRAAAKERS